MILFKEIVVKVIQGRPPFCLKSDQIVKFIKFYSKRHCSQHCTKCFGKHVSTDKQLSMPIETQCLNTIESDFIAGGNLIND